MNSKPSLDALREATERLEQRQANSFALMLTHYDYSDRWTPSVNFAWWVFFAVFAAMIIGALCGY